MYLKTQTLKNGFGGSTVGCTPWFDSAPIALQVHTPLYGSTFLQLPTDLGRELPDKGINDQDDDDDDRFGNFTRFSYMIDVQKHTVRPKSILPCYKVTEGNLAIFIEVKGAQLVSPLTLPSPARVASSPWGLSQKMYRVLWSATEIAHRS